ncbi:hypothetical protein FisN_4Lh463 [Fistulifera solaris]|uniref:Uncharacterized protein n=1 Tax=Fistulifera solaris TaxID=1519565 RepID=A0A1Z5KDZ4_FISSO|nr:hypothetical protein FisN_4Lh463 [Fistulifera solaris]|eukprot:GAX24342.1 hypothetical protein FisN_4Lh463 [Fistulifera solaris]
MAPPSKLRGDMAHATQRRGREAFDSSPKQPRPRSLSGGRNTVRSNDLVQGVYDRLGVARGNNTSWSKGPSAKSTSDDLDPILASAPTQEENHVSSSSSTGGITNGRMNFERSASFHDRQKNFEKSQPGGRGRSNEPTRPEENRSRSLSRGRVADKWPPAREVESTVAKKPSWRGLNGSSAHNVNTTTAHRSFKGTSSSYHSPTPTNSSPVRLSPAKSPKHVSSSLMMPSLDNDVNKAKEGADQTETTENSDNKEVFESVRERMRRYSGTGAKTLGSRFPRRDGKQYGASLSSRQFPPKVNIYGSSNENLDHTNGENDLGIADEKKDDDAGTDYEGAGAARYSSALSRASTHAKSHHFNTDISLGNSHFKSGNKVADSYVSSLQASPKPQAKSFNGENKPAGYSAPVTEISTQLQETGIDNDANSIAMSSVSQDDLHMPTTPSTRRTMWNDRNRVKAIAPGPSAMDAAFINKMIDDRVQAHIADMETRLGAQMRRFMQQMDDKILERLEKMENKLRSLQDAVEGKRSMGRLGQPLQRL